MSTSRKRKTIKHNPPLDSLADLDTKSLSKTKIIGTKPGIKFLGPSIFRITKIEKAHAERKSSNTQKSLQKNKKRKVNSGREASHIELLRSGQTSKRSVISKRQSSLKREADNKKISNNIKRSKEYKIKQELNKKFEPNGRYLRAQKARIEKTLVEQNLVHILSSNWARLSNGAIQTSYALEQAKEKARRSIARKDILEQQKKRKKIVESRD